MKPQELASSVRRALGSGHTILTRLGLLALMGLAGLPVAAQPELSAEGPWAKGRIIVMPRAGLADAELAKILRPHGGKATRLGQSDLHVVELPAHASEKAVAAQLEHHPHLKFAELDYVEPPSLVPNDPYLGSAWHLTKIGAGTAWDYAQGSGVTIAILDSGVDAAHPDLGSRLVPGWNFFDNNSNTADVYGHGTKVAGAAAAATNNATGVAAVAGQARIMPLRVTDLSGAGYTSMIANGLIYAADRGVRVANVSFANQPARASVVSAAQYMKGKGGLVFVSAGNSGIQEAFTPTTAMIPVGSTNSADAKSSFSSYGGYVALAAPGEGIYSTVRGGTYGGVSGTSFSSPVAAAVAALVMSAKPALSSTQVESLLFSTARDLGTAGRDVYFGYGRVDAAAATRAAVASQTVVADTQAPTVSIAAPLAYSTVTGLTAVNVSATDNVGVTKVELRANGALVAVDSTAPFGFSWDTSKVPNGMANLVASAFDAAGNTAASATVSVNVSNATVLNAPAADSTPPVVKFLSPSSTTLAAKGSVTVSTGATDNSGTTGILQRLYIDGTLVATMSGGTLSYTWHLGKAAVGSHTLKVVATDAANNAATTTMAVTTVAR